MGRGAWQATVHRVTKGLMLAVNLLYVVFIILRYVSSMLTFWKVFIVNFVKSLSATIVMIICFLFFNLLMWCTYKLICGY